MHFNGSVSLGGEHPYLYRTSTPEEWPVLLPFAVLLVVEIVLGAIVVREVGFQPELLLQQLRRG